MLYFLLILTILVLVHELGHYLVSKMFKVKVEEFGIGFPPAIYKKKQPGKTTFSINLLPLGGFVKLYGEDGSNQNDPDSFASKPIMKKILILIAGVFNNFVFGFLILSILLLIGLPLMGDFDEVYNYLSKDAIIQKEELIVSLVTKNSPAENANIKVNDKILGYGLSDAEANKNNALSSFQTYISNNRGRNVYIKLNQNSKEVMVSVVPRLVNPKNDGAIGIGLTSSVYYSYPFGRNFVEAFKMIGKTFELFFKTIGGVFTSIFNLKSKDHNVAGPVGIAVVTKNIAGLGFSYLFAFMASFSINLAIVNMLPIPGLDGGRILMLLIEKIIRRPLGQKIENYSIGIGLAFLILIVIFVTIKDILFYFVY